MSEETILAERQNYKYESLRNEERWAGVKTIGTRFRRKQGKERGKYGEDNPTEVDFRDTDKDRNGEILKRREKKRNAWHWDLKRFRI